MADSQPFSVTKLLAGLGGALLIASFFLPLVNTGLPGASDAFGVRELRRQIESTRDADAVRPLIEPAMQALERFATTPNLSNVTGLASVSRELLDTAASATDVVDARQAAEMRKASSMLGWVRALWLLPLIGLVQLALPAVTRLRGHTGFLGLVGRFWFAWPFWLVAMTPLLADAADQKLLGPAVWALLAGTSLMLIAGLFGVTRRNWWAVILADVAIVAATIFAAATLAEKLR